MCTAHIHFKKNQNYQFWKYNGLCCKLIRRRKTHYWSLQAGNRHVKIKDIGNDIEENLKQGRELSFIYRNYNQFQTTIKQP